MRCPSLSFSPLSGSQSHTWPLSLTSSRSTSEGGPGWLSRAKCGQRAPGPWRAPQSLGWQVPLARAVVGRSLEQTRTTWAEQWLPPGCSPQGLLDLETGLASPGRKIQPGAPVQSSCSPQALSCHAHLSSCSPCSNPSSMHARTSIVCCFSST